jgi:hypothetical protein
VSLFRASFGTLIFCTVMLWAGHAKAEPKREYVRLQEATIPLLGFDAQANFAKAIQDIRGIDQAFQPSKEEIFDKRLDPKGPANVPRLSFKATASFLFIKKTAPVVSDIYSVRVKCVAPALGDGYRLRIDLSPSEAFVKSQAANLLLDFCLQRSEDGQLLATMTSHFEKGANYNAFIGSIVKGKLEARVPELLAAIQSVYQNYTIAAEAARIQEEVARKQPAPKPAISEKHFVHRSHFLTPARAGVTADPAFF